MLKSFNNYKIKMVAMNARPPILNAKAYDSPSVFKPENLMPEARRQRNKEAITASLY